MYNGIIFDKDGTLITIDRLWSTVYRNALKQLAEQFEMTVNLEDSYRQIGIEGEKVTEESIAAIGTVSEVLKGVVGDCFDMDYREVLMAFEALVLKEVKENLNLVEWIHEDIPEMLQMLKKKDIKMAVVTADSMENTLIMLEHLEASQYFTFIGSGDDMDRSPKPSPDQGHVFLEDHQLAKEKVLMVGDSQYDALFAERLGVPFFRISEGKDIQRLAVKVR